MVSDRVTIVECEESHGTVASMTLSVPPGAHVVRRR